MAKTVTVTIEAFKPLDIDLEGFQGKGCKDIADALAAVGETVERKKKPEYKQVRIGKKAKAGRTRIGGR